MDFNSFVDILPDLGNGLAYTVAITIGASLLGLVVAFVLGMMAGSHLLALRGVARTVIEFFRGTSLVVQLFWFAFALPLVTGLSFDYVIVIGIITLALNYGAYAAEVVRGSISAVAPGQHEACVAMNFTYWQKMRLVIVPQAWPEMIPPLSTLAILLLKGSALVSMIGLADLTFSAEGIVANDPQSMTFVFGILLAVYFVLSYLVSSGMRVLERRAKAGIGRGPAVATTSAKGGS